MVFQKSYRTVFLNIILSDLSFLGEDKKKKILIFDLSENHVIIVIFLPYFTFFHSNVIQQVQLILVAMKFIVLIEKHSIFPCLLTLKIFTVSVN